MAKFKDPDTGEITEVLTYFTSVKGDTMIYKGKNGKQLTNVVGKPLELVVEEKPFDPDNLPSLLGFGMKTPAEKKKILQKRAKDHFNKEIKEVKMNMDGKTGKQF